MQPGKWAPFCDMFSISGHKLYAPKGTALLWKREGILVRSFRLGGYQERGLFPGTINAPGIAALSSAVDILRKSHREELRRLRALGKEGLSILRKSGIEYVLESPANSAPGVRCISFPWVKDMEDLLYFLVEHHICVSRFSACSSRVSGPSQILLSMGRSRRRASASIRISLGRWSKRDDFYRLAVESFGTWYLKVQLCGFNQPDSLVHRQFTT